jgi:hypothetical protein
MRDLYREFVKFFVSLRLTVALLALSAVLVFLATLDQVHLGIWAVQEKWFKSFIVLHEVRGIPLPVFPGGYFLGGLLLINLIAAHTKRFAFTWKKAGIQLVHGGLILLLLGELFTGLFQEEYQLRLDEGETKNYSESFRFNELAVIDVTDPGVETVTAIPESLVAKGRAISTPALPFTLVPRAYYPNANLAMRQPPSPGAPAVPEGVTNLATAGLGPRLALTPMAVTYRQDRRNLPAAFIEVITPEGTSLGVYAVSTMLVEPERFSYAGREWSMNMRFQRAYKPYSIQLMEFTHDRYAGTDIPKNFSSRVRLRDADGTVDREVLIFMNNPLRHDGLTFFQAGFDNNDRTTILQVVRNPSWVVPYLSCLLMAVGLFWQFGWHLVHYSARRGGSLAVVGAELPARAVVPPADRSIAIGLVLALRLFGGLIGLWAAGVAEGTSARVAFAVISVEFLLCAGLLLGLVSGRAWVDRLLRFYAWASVVLLAGVVAYGFLGGDIYDAILRWVVIGIHTLTAAALLALARRPRAA